MAGKCLCFDSSLCLQDSCKFLGSSGPPASTSLAGANGGIPPFLVLITLVKTHQISSAQDIKVFFSLGQMEK